MPEKTQNILLAVMSLVGIVIYMHLISLNTVRFEVGGRDLGILDTTLFIGLILVSIRYLVKSSNDLVTALVILAGYFVLIYDLPYVLN